MRSADQRYYLLISPEALSLFIHSANKEQKNQDAILYVHIDILMDRRNRYQVETK